MTRRPLNGLFRRAVQCRDQFVVDRLHDRSHPDKVSMKKRKRKEENPREQRGEVAFMLAGGEGEAALRLSEEDPGQLEGPHVIGNRNVRRGYDWR